MAHRIPPAPLVIVGAGTLGLIAATAAREAGYSGRIVHVNPDSALAPALGTPALHRYRTARVDLVLGALTEDVDTARRIVHVRGHGDLGYERLVVDPGVLGSGARRDDLQSASGVEVLRTPTDAEALGAVRRLLAQHGVSDAAERPRAPAGRAG
ncbi:MAG TPA: hypothetical protein VFY23_03325 [Candidatus Limnocylindrales bacterium]|nr:hypothetical protein [Candidatus Limnocylindrales bacterium]